MINIAEGESEPTVINRKICSNQNILSITSEYFLDVLKSLWLVLPEILFIYWEMIPYLLNIKIFLKKSLIFLFSIHFHTADFIYE